MRRRRTGVFVVVCATTLLGAAHVPAVDLGSVALHGFVSQSYLDTSGNNFLVENSTDGTFSFSDVGINVTAEPMEGLRIGAQLYARDLGESGNFDLKIDWAVGDYRWRDELGFRIGKNRLPLGLYNEVRDADMARPSVLLPQGTYPEIERELMTAYVGGEVYGALSLGKGGQLGYQLFVGQLDLDDAITIRRFFEEGTLTAEASLPIPLQEIQRDTHNVKARMDHIWGGALRWSPPLAGLALKVTYNTSESAYGASTTFNGWLENVPLSLTTRSEVEHENDYYIVGSAEYETGKLRLSAEYLRNKMHYQITVSGLPFPMPPLPEVNICREGYYGQVAYQLTDRFQLSGYYSEFYPDGNDKNGDRFALTSDPDYRAWAKDLALSARFDIGTGWLAKIEAHHIDGAAEQMLTPLYNPDGMERDWNIFIGRLTFYF